MGDGREKNLSLTGKEIVDLHRGKQPMALSEERKYEHKYPEPLAAYCDVVQDPKLFMETIGKLHAAMGTKFMIPIIGGKELDLHRLFVEVTSRGGIEKVIADKRWREITAAFNFPSTATNASFVVRKYYMSLLSHYEQVYFFRSQGWNSPPTASSNPLPTTAPLEKSVEPIVQQSPSILGVQKRKVNGEHTPSGSSNPPVGYSKPPIRMVSGVIDGKFEGGYLVTCNIDGLSVKGFLYHPPENSVSQPSQVSAAIGENSEVKAVRRRRRRKRLSERDPPHPEPNRNPTAAHTPNIIGVQWNNLSESEKAVYQERGLKDNEKSRSEMAAYNEEVKTETVAGEALSIPKPPAEPLIITEDIDSKMEIDDGDLPQDIEEGSDTDDSSDDDAELEISPPEIRAAATESVDLVADPSSEGDGFELRARDDAQMKIDNPSSSEDVESSKLVEPPSANKQ